MNSLQQRVAQVINSIDAEYRIPVITAANDSDGTVNSFATELVAQVWDYPGLDVEGVLHKVCWDVV